MPNEQTDANNTAERKNSQGDVENGNDDSNIQEEVTSTNGGAENQSQQPKTLKKKTKAVDLPLTARVPQLTKIEINNLIENEVRRQINDLCFMDSKEFNLNGFFLLYSFL